MSDITLERIEAAAKLWPEQLGPHEFLSAIRNRMSMLGIKRMTEEAFTLRFGIDPMRLIINTEEMVEP